MKKLIAKAEASELCGISTSRFSVWVRQGIMPPPLPGTRRWSVDAIVAAISRHGVADDAPAPVETITAASAFDAWMVANGAA